MYEEPKLHVDSDWKAEAQAEKERLAAKEAETTRTPDAREMPEANIRTLIEVLAAQAAMGLGLPVLLNLQLFQPIVSEYRPVQTG